MTPKNVSDTEKRESLPIDGRNMNSAYTIEIKHEASQKH